MECVNNVITRYQQCIGKYDKQIWEQAIEREIHKKPENVPRKTAKVNPDLIDVDLFRTSPFSKSKPQQSWVTAGRKALPRVIFFPFYSQWWLRTTSKGLFSLLIFLYLLQVTILCTAYIHNGYSLLSETMSVAHILSPCVMMLVLAVVHIQVVSTYESSSQYSRLRALTAAAATAAANVDKQQEKCGQTYQMKAVGGVKIRKKCERRVEFSGAVDAESTGSLDTGIDLDVRQDSSGSRAGNNRATGHPNNRAGYGNNGAGLGNNRAGLGNSRRVQIRGNSMTGNGSSISSRRAKRHPISGSNQLMEDWAGESEQGEENVHLDLQVIDKSDSTRDWVSKHSASQLCNEDDVIVDTCGERRASMWNNQDAILSKSFPRRRILGSDPCRYPNDNLVQNVTVLNKNRNSRQKFIDLQEGVARDRRSSLSALPSMVPHNNHKASVESAMNSGISCILSDEDRCFMSADEAVKGYRCSSSNRESGISDMYSSPCEGTNETLSHEPIESDITDLEDLNNCQEVSYDLLEESTPNNGVGLSLDSISVANSNSSLSNTCDSSLHSSDNDEFSCNAVKSPHITSHNVCKNSKAVKSPSGTINSCHLVRRDSLDKDKRRYNTKLPAPNSSDLSDSETDAASNRVCRSPAKKKDHDVVEEREMRKEDLEEAGNTEDVSSETEGSGSTCSSSDLSVRDVCNDDARQINGNSNQGIQHASTILNSLASTNDRVSCMIWESDGVHKVNLSVLDIGFTIIQKVDSLPESCHYLLVGLLFSTLAMLTPVAYRIYHGRQDLTLPLSYRNLTGLYTVAQLIMGDSWCESAIVVSGLIQRFFLSLVFFFLLSVAERTFKQRLLYAKNFCYLTSSRRAKKYDLPHFRLNKVRNIKTWLSLRSFLKKRGPQRSVECIVSAAFLLTVIILCIVCLEMLQDYDSFLDYLGNWELAIWCLFLGIYLLRFLTLGTKINQKYRNFSLLITEQMNLYLHMEQKPHKKDELMVANSVLRLAEELLKELESPFKISGLSANPLLYNITKVVVLSAFSAVLTDLFGFKLKLYKIKLKS